MVTVRCNDPKKPMRIYFRDLSISDMFLDIDDDYVGLWMKTSDFYAINLEGGEQYNFNDCDEVQLCDVDISYTPKYEG